MELLWRIALSGLPKDHQNRTSFRFRTPLSERPQPKIPDRSSSDTEPFNVKAFFGFIGLLLIFPLGYAGYNQLDDSGWITHSHDTPTFIKGNWMVGEYRKCTMSVSDPLKLFCPMDVDEYLAEVKPESYSQPNPDPHWLPITYHGRIDRKVEPWPTWKCQRNESSLTCWA